MERLTENDELSDIQARLPSLGDALSSGLQSLPSTFAPEEDAPLEAVLAASPATVARQRQRHKGRVHTHRKV